MAPTVRTGAPPRFHTTPARPRPSDARDGRPGRRCRCIDVHDHAGRPGRDGHDFDRRNLGDGVLQRHDRPASRAEHQLVDDHALQGLPAEAERHRALRHQPGKEPALRRHAGAPRHGHLQARYQPELDVHGEDDAPPLQCPARRERVADPRRHAHDCLGRDTRAERRPHVRGHGRPPGGPQPHLGHDLAGDPLAPEPGRDDARRPDRLREHEHLRRSQDAASRRDVHRLPEPKAARDGEHHRPGVRRACGHLRFGDARRHGPRPARPRFRARPPASPLRGPQPAASA
jgi:hypothetical protein